MDIKNLNDAINAEHMAYCGFDCSECPMYIVTVSGDDELCEQLIDKYSTPDRRLTKDDIRCYGCKADVRYRHPYCEQCGIRTCAIEHGILFNCGECSEYPCAEIIARIPPERSGRKNMDITASLLKKIDNLR